MRTVAEMFAEMKKIADEEGFQFNPVKEELDDILRVCGITITGTAAEHHVSCESKESSLCPSIFITA